MTYRYKFKFITAVFSLLFALNAQASDTIELVVPFPPGGTVDIVARSVQQELAKKTNIKTVVVNKPGGEGVVATQYFLSDQNNKILMTSTGTSLFLKLTNDKLPFDPINDFQIMGPIATASTVLVVSDKSGIADLNDFIQQARTKNLNCGTSNSMAVFFGNYLIGELGLKLTLVPYKGSAMVLSDITGGHIDCAIDVVPVYVGRTGMKVIGVSTPDLSRNFNVPVVARGEYKFENFYAMAPGKNMDPAVRKQIIDTVANLHRDSEFVKSLAQRGVIVNRKFDLNFIEKLNKDYQYLQDLNQRLQIVKK